MLDPYKIHLNEGDWDTSDSGNSDFDEDYFRFQPPPMVILPENVIIIEATTNPSNNDNAKNLRASRDVSLNVKGKKKEKNRKAADQKKKSSGKKKTSKNVTVEELNTKSVWLGISTGNKFNILETSEDESVKTRDDVGKKYSETENSHKKTQEENVFNDIETEPLLFQKTKKKHNKNKKSVQDDEKTCIQGPSTISMNMNILQMTQKKRNQPNLKESNYQSGKSKDTNRASQTSEHDEKNKKKIVSYNALNITYDYDQEGFIYSQTKRKEYNKRQPNLQGPTQYNEKGNKQNTIYSFYKYSNFDFEIYNGPLIEDVQTEGPNIQNEGDPTELSVASRSNSEDPSMSEARKNVDVDTVVDMTQNVQQIMCQSYLTHLKYKEGEPSHGFFYPKFEQTYLSDHKLLDYTTNSNDLIAKTYSFNNSSFLEEQDRLYVEQIYNQTMLEMPLRKKKRTRRKKNKTASISDEDLISHCTKTSDISNEHKIIHESEEVYHYPTEYNVTQRSNSKYSTIRVGQIEPLKSIDQKTTGSMKDDSKENQNSLECPSKCYEYSSNKLSLPEKTNLLHDNNDDGDTFCSKTITDPTEYSVKNKMKKTKKVVCSEDLNVIGLINQTVLIPKPNYEEDSIIPNGRNPIDLSVASMPNSEDPSMSEARKNFDVDTVVDMTQNVQQIMSQSYLTHLKYKEGEPSHSFSYPKFEQTYLSDHKLLDYTTNSNDLIAKTYSFNNSSFLEEQDRLYVEQIYNQTMLEMPLRKKKRARRKKNKTASICDENLKLGASRDQTIMLPITNYEETNRNTEKQSDKIYSHCTKTSDISNEHKIIHESEEVYHYPTESNVTQRSNSKYSTIRVGQIEPLKSIDQKATSSIKDDSKEKQNSLECPSECYEYSSNKLSLPEKTNLLHDNNDDGDTFCSKTITDPTEYSVKNKMKDTKKVVCSEDSNVIGLINQTVLIPKPNYEEDSIIPNGRNPIDLSVASMPNTEDQYMSEAVNTEVDMAQSIQKTMSQSNLTNSIHKKSKPSNNLSYPELIQTYLSNHKLLDNTKNNYDYVTETYSFDNSSFLEETDQIYVEPISNQSTTEKPPKKKKKPKKKKTPLICDEDLKLVAPLLLPLTNDEVVGIEKSKNYIQKATSSTKCDSETNQSLFEFSGTRYENSSNIQPSSLKIVNQLNDDDVVIYSDTITDRNSIDESQKNKKKKKKKSKKIILDGEQICDSYQINDRKVTSSIFNESALVVNIRPMELKKILSNNKLTECTTDGSELVTETYSINYQSLPSETGQSFIDDNICSRRTTKKKSQKENTIKRKERKCICKKENVDVIVPSEYEAVENIQNKHIPQFHRYLTDFNITPKWGRKCQSVPNIPYELGDLEIKPWIPIGYNPTEFCVDSSGDEQFQTTSNCDRKNFTKENKQEMNQKLTPQDEAEITVSATVELFEADAENAHHFVPKTPSILDHCLNSMTNNIPHLVVIGSFVLWLMHLFKEK